MFIGFSDSSHLGKADHEVPIGYVSEYDLTNVVEKLYADYGEIFPFNKQVGVSIRRPHRQSFSTFLMFMSFLSKTTKQLSVYIVFLSLFFYVVFVFLFSRDLINRKFSKREMTTFAANFQCSTPYNPARNMEKFYFLAQINFCPPTSFSQISNENAPQKENNVDRAAPLSTKRWELSIFRVSTPDLRFMLFQKTLLHTLYVFLEMLDYSSECVVMSYEPCIPINLGVRTPVNCALALKSILYVLMYRLRHH
jgi:hypothetical protein